MNLPPPAEGWPAADKAAEALFSRFQIDTSRKFGEGGYGATYAAIDNAATGAARNCAAKVVNLSKMKLESLQDECRVLDNLGKDGGHPNVIKLLGHGRGRRSAKQEGQYFIFMEAASGGELFDVVIDRGAKAMTEEEARGFFIGVLSGLMHCHSRGIVHRDMKLENVLLSSEGTIKLIDFGLSHTYGKDANGQWDRSQPLRRLVGSKSYVAPEVLSGVGYDGFIADVWSLGVCLFSMLAGFFPLSEANAKDWRFGLLQKTQEKGVSSTVTIHGWYKRKCQLSPGAINLIDSMLACNPKRRIPLGAIAAHEWTAGAPLGGAAAKAALGRSPMTAALPVTAMEEEGPRWRAANPGMDAESLMALLELNDGEGLDDAETAPIYRKLGVGLGEALPLPAFDRQHACTFAAPE